MNTPPSVAAALFERFLEASWQASLLAMLVIVIQWTMRRHLSPAWRCAMWSIVFLRLALPVVPESRLNPMTLVAAGPQDVATTPTRVTVVYGAPPQASSESVPAGTVSTTPRGARSAAWPQILVAAWLAGIVAIAGRMIVGNIVFARRVRRSVQNADARLRHELNKCCRRAGIAKMPRLLITDLVTVPSLFSVLRPAILLPAGFTERLSSAELRFILLHELAHLRRRDLLVEWLVGLVVAVHWFNPIAWLAARRFRFERELACDARVLKLIGGGERTTYGETILRVLEMIPRPARIPGTVGIVERRDTLHGRIAAIAAPVRASRLRSAFAAAIVAILACSALTRPAASAPPTQPATGAVETTQVYELEELRRLVIPNFRPDFVNWPDPATAPAADDVHVGPYEDVADWLITSAADEIDPSSWRNRGGETGEIREEGEQLIIITSPENQERLAKVIQRLRERRATQVTVEARFITGERIFDAVEDLGGKWSDDEQVQVWSEHIADEDVARILDRADDDAAVTTLTAPRITLFDGQRAFVLVANETSYTTDFIPTAREGQFEPVTEIVPSGIVLDVTPTVSEDRSEVELHLRPRVSTLLDMEELPWPGAPAGRDDLLIQRPHTRGFTLDRKIAVPVGRTLLLRGQPRREPPDPDAPPDEPVLMLVRAVVLSE